MNEGTDEFQYSSILNSDIHIKKHMKGKLRKVLHVF